MRLENLTPIGTVKRSHGLDGKLKVTIEQFYVKDIPQLTAVVIEKGEDFLPFFIEYAELSSQPILLKFESIHSKEEASKLNGKILYAITKELSGVKENEFDLIIGMSLYNQDNQRIGVVKDIVEYPNQTLLEIDFNSKELLLPFHEDLILSINVEEKIITVKLPDGLLDIYS